MRRRYLLSTTSHNAILSTIPPLTSDNYRNIMTKCATFLSGVK